jgi:hypothetical protein
MVRTLRRGIGRLGCLLMILVFAAVVYFGVPIGEAYYRYYRLKDAMSQEIRFADTRTDDEIRRRLSAAADSLGLPASAARFSIRRDAARMVIETRYHEIVELPMMVRDLPFTARVERAF